MANRPIALRACDRASGRSKERLSAGVSHPEVCWTQLTVPSSTRPSFMCDPFNLCGTPGPRLVPARRVGTRAAGS